MCSAVVPETNELLRNTRSSRLPDMSAALLLLMTILGAEGTAAKPAPVGPGKLAPAVAKEMTESIVAVNKALGLESWPSHGATPCVDRGGQGITAKSVTPEDTRRCATTAIEKNFPELGKSYVLAIPMASLGPITVIALGIGDADGWGAYSCDPQRKCAPVKVGAPSKWGKRVAERKAKACSADTTLWFPVDQKACGGTPAAATAPAAPTAPAAATPPPAAPTTPPTAAK
jgi:hypothetical protein